MTPTAADLDVVTFAIAMDEEDVVLGLPRSCHSDPVASAIKRAIPDLFEVSVTRRTILLRFAERSRAWGSDGPAAWIEIDTPAAVAAWIDAWDAEPSDALDPILFDLSFHPERDRFRADRY